MKYFRRIALVFSLILVSVLLKAQQNHFIYLQTENKQPFYVKMGKTIYNSTISGYLIIPKLKEGNYDFLIGFVGTENEEQKFSSAVEHADAGYLVKKFGDKGWGLFNLQTLQVTMSGNTAKEELFSKNTTVKSDEFSQMLSTVVNDPAIKYEEKAEPTLKEEKKDTPVIESGVAHKEVILTDSTSVSVKESPKTEVAAISRELFGKISKRSTTTDYEGLRLMYFDSTNQNIDTIGVFIPFDHSEEVESLGTDSSILKQKIAKDSQITKLTSEIIDSVSKVGKMEEVKGSKQENEKMTSSNDSSNADGLAGKKFLNIEMPVEPGDLKKDSSKVLEVKNVGEAENKSVMSSGCKDYSTDADFLKLRKKMASADSEEDMLAAAKKAFKAKCYTTAQIKNLGVLFLNDVGRYNFFDVAYPSVSDQNNFNQLQDQLIDQYYKNRFKAMLRQ